LLLVACLAIAQEITIRPQWKAGDKFEFEHLQTHEEVRRPQSKIASSTPLFLEVVETSPQGHTVLWRYGKTKLPVEREAPPALAKAEEMLLDLAIEARLEPNGEFQKVSNETAVAAKFNEVLKAVAATLPPDAAESTLLKQMLNPQMLLASATGDMRAFFAPYGVKLRGGEKTRVTVSQPFPLQPGRSLTVQLYFGISGATEEKTEFQSVAEYDIQQVGDRVLEWLTTTGMRVQDRSQMPQLFLSETGEFRFDNDRGVMSRAVVTRRSTMVPGYDRTERREFVLK
jgi:hypothetical protein